MYHTSPASEIIRKRVLLLRRCSCRGSVLVAAVVLLLQRCFCCGVLSRCSCCGADLVAALLVRWWRGTREQLKLGHLVQGVAAPKECRVCLWALFLPSSCVIVRFLCGCFFVPVCLLFGFFDLVPLFTHGVAHVDES